MKVLSVKKVVHGVVLSDRLVTSLLKILRVRMLCYVRFDAIWVMTHLPIICRVEKRLYSKINGLEL